MSGKIDSIKIRMYKTGSVGDCILLLFHKAGILSFSMLIDCGGYNTTAALISPCVEDINTTSGGKLDLLVVTHEHLDHISGFNLARAVFDKITVTDVWMSWAEDKTDPIAKVLKDKYGKKLKELKKTAETAQANIKKFSQTKSSVMGVEKRLQAHKQSIDQTMELLDFEEGASHGKGLVAGRLNNNDAMNYVKNKGKKITYQLPGDVIDNMAGAEGIKFYILGPPRDPDLKFIKIEIDPDEIYKLALKPAANNNNALPPENHIVRSGVTLTAKASPFTANFIMSGKEQAAFNKQYNNAEYKWRQIETDWMESSDGMALALNRFVNNTSLAMALEFENSGNVILLPADAQSGNWISWQKPDLMKSLKTKGGKDTNELLAATVFYKVGHHGSHNGTASVHGLDKITSKKLVAFMPLVQDKVPVAWGGAANFPAKKLYQELIDKTQGRVVRTDEGLINDNNAAALRTASQPLGAPLLTSKSLGKSDLYFEYTVTA